MSRIHRTGHDPAGVPLFEGNPREDEGYGQLEIAPRSNDRPLNKSYITGGMKSGAPDPERYGKDGLVEVWSSVAEK